MAGSPTLTRRAWLGAGLGAALSARAEQANQTVLTAVADATLFAEQSGGTAYDAVADGQGANLWTSVLAAGVVRRALLRFDTAAVPPGAQVVQVQLELFAIRIRLAQSLTLHRVLAPWGEGPSNGGDAGVGAPAQAGDSTWSHRVWPNQAWAQRGGDYDAAASGAAQVSGWPAPVVWNSTPALVADVQRWVDDPSANHGWLLRGDEVITQNATRLASREIGDTQARPRLRVSWLTPLADAQVPLPPWALGLLGVGAAAALLRQRPKPR